LTANSLQRKTGTAPETTEQNPQLLSNWGCIIAAISTALKKWWQKELLFTTTHWPGLSFRLFYISFLEFDR
jgi:hypothetical protein